MLMPSIAILSEVIHKREPTYDDDATSMPSDS
jgi:hypothetical protein